MKITIAGAGIGGLTAALCLNKFGYEVQILERSSELVEVGAGIQLGANALKVMDYLGLMERIKSSAVSPEKILFRHYQSGEVLHQMSLGSSYRTNFDAPYYHLHRADLQRILVDELRQLNPDSLRLNSTVNDYLETEDSVHIHLADNTVISSDCLIGADGIKSKIRDKLLHGQSKHIQPIFSGYEAWRAVVDVNKLPNEWMDKVATNYVGPEKHMVTYYLRNQKLVNMVAVVKSKPFKGNADLNNDSWVTKANWSELKSDFNGWHDSVQQLIDVLDQDECYRWPIYHHRSFQRWTSNRVSLLGDAAHSMLPYMASGAAMAIEDACILSRCINKTESVTEAFGLYQKIRFNRRSKVHTATQRLGKIYHMKHDLARKVAFAGMKLMSAKQQDFLAGYNALTVELD